MSADDRIELTGLRAVGYHGVFEHERREGQEFGVDVVLHTDLSVAGGSDDLADTVNYADVALMVHARITGEPFDLIEALAEAIASDILADVRVQAVEVVVHKPSAPVQVAFDDIRVRVLRRRGVPR